VTTIQIAPGKNLRQGSLGSQNWASCDGIHILLVDALVLFLFE